MGGALKLFNFQSLILKELCMPFGQKLETLIRKGHSCPYFVSHAINLYLGFTCPMATKKNNIYIYIYIKK